MKTPRVLRKIEIQNFLALAEEAEKQGKTVVSVSLDPETAEYLKQHPNASAIIQELLKNKETQENKDEITTLKKRFTEAIVKYGFHKPPNLEDMKHYKAYVTTEGDFSHFKEENLAPEHYPFHIIMLPFSDMEETEDSKFYNSERIQLLKEARKIPYERRVEILWQTIQEAKEDLTLIKFVADHLIDYTTYPHHEKTSKISIRKLSEQATTPYQEFYLKTLPKIQKIINWNNLNIEIGKEPEPTKPT